MLAVLLPSSIGRTIAPSWLPMSVLLSSRFGLLLSFQNPSVERIVKLRWQEYCIGSFTRLPFKVWPLSLPAYRRPARDKLLRSGVPPLGIAWVSLLNQLTFWLFSKVSRLRKSEPVLLLMLMKPTRRLLPSAAKARLADDFIDCMREW